MKHSTLVVFSRLISLYAIWALSIALLSCTPLEFGVSPEAECSDETNCGPGKRCIEGFCQPLMFELCDGSDNDLDGEIDEGLLNACLQCGPTPTEVCNRLDDDCDGSVDEEFENLDQPCMIERGDDAGSIGLWACDPNGRTECVKSPNISEELCDGSDNDLDGMIDEGLEDAEPLTCPIRAQCPENVKRGQQWCEDGQLKNDCTAGDTLPDDSCDGVDDDCDGTLDEDFGAEVSCGVSEECMRPGRTTCVDGEAGDNCNEVLGSGESCNNIDDDCDGEIDEVNGMQHNIDLPNADKLGQACNEGVCRATYRHFCQDGVGFIYCTDNVDYVLGQHDPYAPEVAGQRYDWCGNGDEDCDGRLDEDSRPNPISCPGSDEEGAYACVNINEGSEESAEEETRAIYQYLMVGCPGNTSRPEVCNGVDDDQDGLVDNNVRGMEMCCPDGWLDEPDLSGSDTNCDGLDGHVNGTVFVSEEYGSDLEGQGTALSPYATIAQAIRLTQRKHRESSGQSHTMAIYVAVGDYNWSPLVVDVEVPLMIYGGYEVTRATEDSALVWSRPPLSAATGETVFNTVVGRPAIKLFNASSRLTLQRVKFVVPNLAPGQLERSNFGLILGECAQAHLSAVHIQVGSALPGQAGVNGSDSFSEEAMINHLNAYGNAGENELSGSGGVNQACCLDASCSGGQGGLPNQEGQSGFALGVLVDGLGGIPVPFTPLDNINTVRTLLSGLDGQPGSPGLNAVAPVNRYGVFSSSSYLWLEATESATEATSGLTGGGGGGGAGSPGLAFITEGRGGGGGGAGGCGGRAGSNGSAGGWSVGVVLSERCTATIEQVTITTGAGGQGGAGAFGGRGQVGYTGGLGAIPLTTGYSGDGGRGGRGGCGGHGSSGHGGNSVGLVYLGDVSGSTVNDVVMSLGQPGAPGDAAPQRYELECTVPPSGSAGEPIESLCCGTLVEGEQRYTGCAPCAE